MVKFILAVPTYPFIHGEVSSSHNLSHLLEKGRRTPSNYNTLQSVSEYMFKHSLLQRHCFMLFSYQQLPASIGNRNGVAKWRGSHKLADNQLHSDVTPCWQEPGPISKLHCCRSWYKTTPLIDWPITAIKNVIPSYNNKSNHLHF